MIYIRFEGICFIRTSEYGWNNGRHWSRSVCFLLEGDNRQDHMHSWRALLSLNTVFQRQSKVGTATIYCLLLLRAHATCVSFSSVVPASVKSTERTVYTVIQSHWSCPLIKPGFPPGLSRFSSGLTGSLSSSLHENYSMGELKECGVHSVEQ